MPLASTTIFDVRTTGSDTANGGAFDPGQTAGMFTDGAATSATGNSAVFSSASYNFVAGDVGAWIYIASGTNWYPGWYQIASVASNVATLTSTSGSGVWASSTAGGTTLKRPITMSTSSGVASVASPTGATWSIDYSQQSAAQFSYTDLASAGAGLTVSSATTPFAKQMVGNMLVVASGTNFTAGNYVIASVAAGVATVVGAANITTGAGSVGVGGLGGAMATIGKATSKRVSGNAFFIKSGTYTFANTTANTAGGPVTDTVGGVGASESTWYVGWDTQRTLFNTGTRPVLSAGAQTTFTLFSITNSYIQARNFIVDGNSGASTVGFYQEANYDKVDRIKAQNCTSHGLQIRGGHGTSALFCEATGCSGTAAIRIAEVATVVAYGCEAYGNTATSPFRTSLYGVLINCISSGNSGIGFDADSVAMQAYNCVAYSNSGGGFDCDESIGNVTLVNCIAEANTGYGFVGSSVRASVRLLNCGGYNNSSGNYQTGNIFNVQGFQAASGSFFTNAASGDFSPVTGSAARNNGAPGTLFARGLTVSYDDIGAAHHQDPSGGGGLASNPLRGFL